jgi:hypothetical protein
MVLLDSSIGSSRRSVDPMQYPEDSELLFLSWDKICPHRQSDSSFGDLSSQSPLSPLPPALSTLGANEQDEFIQNPPKHVPEQSVPTPDFVPAAEGVYYHRGRWCCLTVGCLNKPNGWKSEKNAIHHVQVYHLGKEPLQCPWPGWYVCLSPMNRSRTNCMQ